MRTLNKALCLVLAVVMCFGLLAVGASAAFTDEAKITANYKEAVEVMTGIGVIDGKGGNVFDPTGSLTREQAAKIVCFIVLGPTNASKISAAGVSTFADVAADRWSAGYIEYAANMKIIAGVGDGRFNPEGKLSTAAFGKMLLCAVGYDAVKEGLEGGSWAVNVAALATSKKLVETKDNITISASIDCTREQACQMAFNALFLQRMEANYGRDSGEAYFQSYNAKDTCLAKDVFGYAAANFGIESGSRIANGLARNATTQNGVAGYKWYYKTTDETKPISGFYNNEKIIGSSYDGTAIYADAGKCLTRKDGTNAKFIAKLPTNFNATDTYTSGAYQVFANGVQVTAVAPDTISGGYWFNTGTKTLMYEEGTTSSEINGPGVLIELADANDDASTAEKIYVSTYQVKVLNKAPVVKTNTVDGKDYVYVEFVGGDHIGISTVVGSSGAELASVVEGYEGLAKDDVVMYYDMAAGKKLVKLTPEVAQATAAVVNESLTINGTVVKGSIAADSTLSSFNSFYKDVKFYKDSFGYLVHAEPVTPTSTDYLMTTEVGGFSASLVAGETNKCAVVFDDGTTGTISVASLDTYKWSDGSIVGNAPTVNSVYAYIKNADGTYSLITPKATASTSTGTVTKGVSGAVKGDAETKYIVRDKSGSTYLKTWTKYVGFGNVPSVTDASWAGARDANGYADVAFITEYNLVATSAKDVIYLLGTTPTKVYKDTTTVDYYAFPAIVNGEKTVIKAAANTDGVGATLVKTGSFTAGSLYTVTYSDGKVVANALAQIDTTAGGFVVADGIKAPANGLVAIGSGDYAYSDKCVVFVISNDYQTVTVTDINGYSESTTSNIDAVSEGATVTGTPTATQLNNMVAIYVHLAA